ncbi:MULTISPECIES: alpha/beta hydrolase [unclassified Rhizobium]|uniref:alpha/beta hydrolase n=1 Tax=unclassified Rhizobium TaxID=2613769 RepID=UPI0025FC7929|nr:alpha/beta hydrolase [Rhizobium sp. UBA1881]
MADRWHVNWLSEGVEQWNRRRKKVTFAPDLSGIRFFDLLPPDFRDAPKTSRFFERIDLSNANLAGADLSGLNFCNAAFSGANLTEADMSKSNFEKAKFTRANLAGANIARSLFSGAIFDNSIVTGVAFESAHISSALFIGSKLDTKQQNVAAIHSVRVFPDRESYRSELAERADSSKSSAKPHFLKEVKEEKPKTRKNKYDVFFGTNRIPVYTRGVLTGFNGNLDPNLSYGVCEVDVPEGHQIGSLGSPLWKRLVNRKDDRLKIETLIPLNGELFWSLLRDTSLRMKIKERPTIFVHGFNNSFEQAVIRSAQIGYDLGLGQGIGLFSWPSKGNLLSYNADEAAAEASKYALAEFIEQFVRHSTQGSANIIAHSMGCRCVLGAIEVLAAKQVPVEKYLNQVILAAADVDSAIMPHVGIYAVKHSTRTTSYISDRDKALKISGWLHSFPRIGITPPTFVLQGMDTILVNNLNLGDFAHGYVGTSRTILGDIFTLLSANSPPNERHAIEAISASGTNYWRIRD